MNKIIIAVAATILITGALTTGCTSPAEKTTTVEKTTTTVAPAVDHSAEMEAYRKANAERIADNEKNLAELKAQIELEKAETKIENQKRLAELEQKNRDLKKKLDDYKDDGSENWETFKAEFGHDMDGLGQSFKDLTVKNVK